MIINTNLTTANTFRIAGVPSSKSGKPVQEANSADNNILKIDRRFDSFINQVSQSFIGKLNERIEARLTDIINTTEENKRYTAHMHKEHMKRLTKEAIEHEERELEKFNDLRAQKAHYQDIYDNNGYVRNGKFAFGGVNSSRVCTNEVRKLLDSVQEKINDIVTARVRKESDPFDTKTFEYLYSGAAFLAATHMKNLGAVMLRDSSVSGQWSRTEENFAEESKRSTDSLNQRLKDIDSMYNAFRRDGTFSERLADLTVEDKARQLLHLMNIFDRWNQKAMLTLLSFGDVDESELMKSFERIVNP
jgi:hypothetical protein